MDIAIHRINRYLADKHLQNQLSYPVDSDLPGGYRYPSFEQLGPGIYNGVTVEISQTCISLCLRVI